MALHDLPPAVRLIGGAVVIGASVGVAVHYLHERAPRSEIRQLSVPTVEEQSNQQLVTLLDSTVDERWAGRIRDELLQRARQNPATFIDDAKYLCEAVTNAEQPMTREVALNILRHLRQEVPDAIPDCVTRVLDRVDRPDD